MMTMSSVAPRAVPAPTNPPEDDETETQVTAQRSAGKLTTPGGTARPVA